MNASKKARWANILTSIVATIAIVQSAITNPPFSDATIFLLSSIFTYLALAGTAWKQYLSPDVSVTGQSVTIWIAVIATIAGLVDLLPAVNIPPATSQWIKWAISIIIMIINVLSKQIFPSEMQKEKMHDLKKQS